MSTAVPRDELSPSQLYISARKLRAVMEWFDFDSPAYEPCPAYVLDGTLILMDGHTRAFVAYLGGANSIRIRELEDSEAEELNLGLYRECLEWCRQEGVSDLSDFIGRVVSHSAFEELWIDRCHSSPYHE